MRSQLHLWQQKLKLHPTAIITITSILITITGLTIIIYISGWNWTGFNGGYSKIITTTSAHGTTTTTEQPQQKTLWDWLQLLIIPVVLAIAGYIFTLTTSKNEQKSIEQRNKTEHDIALDSQQEAALQDYIDKLSELILEKDLLVSKPEDNARKIARARTIITLPRLGKKRKKSLLQFLHESGLINRDNSIVSLSGADLREADLSMANLYEADLREANLLYADLGLADLRGADLRKASLGGAKLCAASLGGADLREANLNGADLRSTHLYGANLNGTYLGGANLHNAFLREANLSEAHLHDADLSGAHLRDANLSGTTITTEQLEKTKSLQGAIMSDWSKHP